MSKKGFTLIEVLMSLFITLLIILNCSLLVKVLKFSDQSKHINISLENAIYSLSKELITAKNIEYGDSLNYFDENGEAHKIILQNNRLVITPGYHILCHDINSVHFENNYGLIKIFLSKNNENYSFIVGSDYEKKEEW
nr:prepilin-type N-terminal cleavage/methylation domain-containing protein [uncultured Faecalibacillus sp.]